MSKPSASRLIANEIKSRYISLLKQFSLGIEVDDYPQEAVLLMRVQDIPPFYGAYLCGFIGIDTVDVLMKEHVVLENQHRTEPVSLPDILDSLKIKNPTVYQLYTRIMTPDKERIARHLDAVSFLNSFFMRDVHQSYKMLDLSRYKTLSPWVSVTDAFEDRYLKLKNIAKVLNFYFVSGRQDNVFYPALSSLEGLTADLNARFKAELTAVADAPENAGIRARILGACGLWNRLIPDKLFTQQQSNALQNQLYHEVREALITCTRDDQTQKHIIDLFDTCMDVRGRFADNLAEYHQTQDTTLFKTPAFVQAVLNDWDEEADLCRDSAPTHPDMTERQLRLAAFAGASDEMVLWWTGLCSQKTYDTIVCAKYDMLFSSLPDAEASTDARLISNDIETPDDVPLKTIFQYLMNKDIVLPLRDGDTRLVDHFHQLGFLSDQVFVCAAEKQDMLDVFPDDLSDIDRDFTDPDVRQIFKMSILANQYMPTDTRVRHHLQALTYQSWHAALASLGAIPPHPQDADVVQRTQLMKREIEHLLPPDSQLSQPSYNKLMTQTRQLIYRHMDTLIQTGNQILTSSQGTEDGQIWLSELAYHDISTTSSWEKAWRHAVDKGLSR